VVVDPASLPAATNHGPFGSIATTGSQSVALTFDDGPDPVYTPQLLDLLKAHGVKATFCVVGRQAKAYPGLIRRIAAEGHTLCNHSYTHPTGLGLKPRDVMLKEIRDTSNAIRRALPSAVIKYFRAPSGSWSQELINVAASQGLRPLHWSLDTRDWEFAKYPKGPVMMNNIIAMVQTKIRRGAIILSHDYRKPDTIAAYRKLLPWLKARVTLIPLPT
jgi:peptidoglycan/xylan/chitin deacetylase (PgdA/CDA1 family)